MTWNDIFLVRKLALASFAYSSVIKEMTHQR